MPAVDAAAVNPNDIKTLLANGSFFIKDKPVFSNGPIYLPRNLPDCTVLDSSIFDNFILADELIAKRLRILKICISVNNNLSGKLVSSLETLITFDERFKVTSVPFFIPDFNLLSCELENFTFKLTLSHLILIFY